MIRIVLVALACLPASALADIYVPPPAGTDEVVELSDSEEPRFGVFGVSFDAGLPSGLGASLVVRPWAALRLEGGALTNGVGGGARGGLSLVAYPWLLAPSIGVEAGRLFDADASAWATSGVPASLLARVGYDFATAHAGLELGSQQRYAFFVHGGVSWVDVKLPGFGDAVRDLSGAARVTAEPAHLRILTPSLKAGLVLYFG